MIKETISPIFVQEKVPLAGLTTFGIGGLAKFFCSVCSSQELAEAVRMARKNKTKFFILGGGSNILVADSGFPGLVIKNNNNKITQKKNKIKARSGAKLSGVVALSIKNSLSGLECCWGVPGTVGGAIVGNAGAKENWISQAIETVTVLTPKNKVQILTKDQCQFDYRSSRFQVSQEIILEVVFNLKLLPQEEVNQKQQEFFSLRASQPQEKSAGSIFKNPPAFSAGQLIDQVGLKGKRIGDAQISPKHANFIVNTNNAQAKDVLSLIKLIQKEVFSHYQIKLKPEIKFIGFAKSEIADIIK